MHELRETLMFDVKAQFPTSFPPRGGKRCQPRQRRLLHSPCSVVTSWLGKHGSSGNRNFSRKQPQNWQVCPGNRISLRNRLPPEGCGTFTHIYFLVSIFGVQNILTLYLYFSPPKVMEEEWRAHERFCGKALTSSTVKRGQGPLLTSSWSSWLQGCLYGLYRKRQQVASPIFKWFQEVEWVINAFHLHKMVAISLLWARLGERHPRILRYSLE